jgi:hypothetical protein
MYGPYSRIYNTILKARQTGTTSQVSLIQQQIKILNFKPNIYHVGLVIEDTETKNKRIFEHGPIAYDPHREFTDAVVVPLPSVCLTLEDIAEYHQTLPETYIIGVRDCRHHVVDLLTYLYLSL